MTDGLLTVRQTAEILGITRRRVNALIEAGRLPATMHGNAWAIKENDLEIVKERPTGRPPKSKEGAPYRIVTEGPISDTPGTKVAYFIPSPPTGKDDS